VLQGDELRKRITSLTATTAKYLTNLTEAVSSGQYIDLLALTRLPSV
jgi:hypothetical protein